MLDPVAERRPSARKLLERLPPQEDDENLKDALRVLSEPHSAHYALLMDNLFAPERVLLPVIPQGEEEGLVTPGAGLRRAYCSPLLLDPPADLFALQRARDVIVTVFRRHGAVELTLPPLWLKQAPAAPGSPESLVPFVIESGGHVLGLHTGGRLPLCHYLSVQSPLATFKRFTYGVAHRLPPQSTKPSSSRLGFTAQLVADFDIVAPAGSPATLVEAMSIEAELIRVAYELLSGFGLSPSVALSHPDLQSALLDMCHAPPDESKRAQLRLELNKVAGLRREWPAVAARLRKWCAAEVVHELEKYICVWKPEALPKLLALLHGRLPPGETKERAKAAVLSLQAACAGAVCMGVPAEMLEVDARLSLSQLEFPSGLHMQVATSRHSVLMRGGRWDALLVATGAERRVAVGLTVGTKRLLDASLEASADGRGASASQPLNELECCVCSAPGLHEARMELAAALWREGVKADLAHDGDLRSQMAHAAALGVALVATLNRVRDATGAEREVVTIKQLRRKEELEVERVDAVKQIKQVLHSQPSRSITGRLKPRQGTISPPPERRNYHDSASGSGSATTLKVSL